MKQLVSIILFFLLCDSFAQKEGNIWYFGDSAGVSFNTSIPDFLLNGNSQSSEISSTICDKDGNLLFYAGSGYSQLYDNILIWNSNNELLNNVDSIFGDMSITQGLLLLPKPGSKDISYLFHLRRDGFFILYLTVLDKNGDAGHGSIINKNIQLSTNNEAFTEKMIAIKHANGRDWWLLLHESNNNNFVKYLVTPNVILGPYKQDIGSNHTGNWYRDIGQMTASKNGDKLICVNAIGVLDLFNFDRCSGELSNWINLSDSVSKYYGCEFSSDESKIYVTEISESSLKSKLFQFNLNDLNILQTKTLLMSINDMNFSFGQLKLGIDEKLYVSKSNQNWGFPTNDSVSLYLGIIENPDLLGIPCNYDDKGQFLGGKRSTNGLPNIPNYYLGAMIGSECDTIQEPLPVIENFSYIPNVFSPNNDGSNDCFYVRGKNIKGLVFRIYNRFGNLVFETSETNHGWDGRYRSADCPEGVYYYYAEITFINGEIKIGKGNVTLIR